jgi:hypothetical protein
MVVLRLFTVGSWPAAGGPGSVPAVYQVVAEDDLSQPIPA